jgi:hypothetical protein
MIQRRCKNSNYHNMCPVIIMFTLKRLQWGCHKSFTKIQTSQRHKRVIIQIIKDTDITEPVTYLDHTFQSPTMPLTLGSARHWWHLAPLTTPDDDDDDVYLECYSGKGFHINYSCLYVLRNTHKLVQ